MNRENLPIIDLEDFVIIRVKSSFSKQPVFFKCGFKSFDITPFTKNDGYGLEADFTLVGFECDERGDHNG